MMTAKTIMITLVKSRARSNDKLQSKCIKAGFLTVPLILEGAHTQKNRAGDCESAFFVSLQYVVGANSSYTSSCLMSLSRCSSKEDAATSQKICKQIQIVGGGETV